MYGLAKKRLMKGVATACFALSVGGGASFSTMAAEPELVRSGSPHEALFDVTFDGQHGYAVGMPMLLLETNDAGKSWDRVNVPGVMGAFLGVAVSGDQALLVGQMGLIARKTAGGWQQADSGTQERLLEAVMDDQGNAMVTGAFGTMLASHDGGASWHSVSPEWEPIVEDIVEPHMNALAMDGNGSIYAGGEFGIILRSDDHGETWNVEHKGDESVFALHVDETGTVWAVGQRGLIMRRKADGDWTRIETSTEPIYLDIASNGAGELIVTGIRTMLVIDLNNKTIKSVKNKDIKTNWYQGVASPGAGQSGSHIIVGHGARILANQ